VIDAGAFGGLQYLDVAVVLEALAVLAVMQFGDEGGNDIAVIEIPSAGLGDLLRVFRVGHAPDYLRRRRRRVESENVRQPSAGPRVGHG
jgi:hypothetical protein